MAPRIGLELPHGAGIGRYGTNLIRHLARLHPQADYVFFPGGSRRLGPALANDGAHRSRLVWRQLALPRLLKRHSIDLFHGLFPAVPMAWAPSVMTIYDLTGLLLPACATMRDRLITRLLLRAYAHKASHILTISEHSKQDIVRLLGIPPEKATVAFPGVDPCFRPISDTDALAPTLQHYKILRPFVLFVGTLEPRKNIATLLKAYESARSTNASNHQLVIVGRKGWLHNGILETIELLGLRDRVILTGPVPDPDLVHLYNAAELFVYPSLYEGFGLPPLEAMACGTPTITSNAGALPEVVGDAALTVDPRDPEGLATAIVEVLQDAGMRQEMSERGLARASMFSWADTAAQTMSVYRKVLDQRCSIDPTE